MFVVLACGIPRSGSTWLYNAARLILGHKYASVRGGWIEDCDRTPDVDALLIKTHEPTDFEADKLLTSHRDLRDIIASLLSMGWATQSNISEMARFCRNLHDGFAPRADLDLAFETIVHEPLEALRQIADALGVSTSPDTRSGILRQIPTTPGELDARGHDPVTLLHRGHITDGRSGRWRQDLDPQTAQKIAEEHHDWLRKFGYIC